MREEQLVRFVLPVPQTYLARLLWLRVNSIGSILDVACGEGFIYSLTLKLAVSPNLILISPKMEATALDLRNYKIYRRPGKPPVPKLENFVQADAHHLPFKDKSFDTVVLSETLEHPLNPIAVLMEARRVARKRILVTVPDEESWIRKRVFRHFSVLDSIEHVRLFNAEKLKNYFEQAGLTSFQIQHILFGGLEYYVSVVGV